MGRRRDRPEKPCTYCNRCLVSAMKNPMGCYDVSRYPNREAMIDAVMSVYRVHGEIGDADRRGDVAMSDIDAPFTAVQIALRKRMWLLALAAILAAALALIGLAAVVLGGVALVRFGGNAIGLRRRRRPLHVRLDRRRDP